MTTEKPYDHTLYLEAEPRENVKYFAAHALMGLVPATTFATQGENGDINLQGVSGAALAPRCFDIAEAMMAEYVARCQRAYDKQESIEKAATEAAQAVEAANVASAEGATLQ